MGEKTLVVVKGEYAMDEAAEVGLDESYPELLVVEYLQIFISFRQAEKNKHNEIGRQVA